MTSTVTSKFDPNFFFTPIAIGTGSARVDISKFENVLWKSGNVAFKMPIEFTIIHYLLNLFVHLASVTNFAIIHFLSLDKLRHLLLPGKLTALRNQKLKRDEATATPFKTI